MEDYEEFKESVYNSQRSIAAGFNDLVGRIDELEKILNDVLTVCELQQETIHTLNQTLKIHHRLIERSVRGLD